MTFVQENLFIELSRTQSIEMCSIKFGCRTQSNTISWIEFDWVQFVRLSSIGSEIELTTKFGVRIRSTAELNGIQSTD